MQTKRIVHERYAWTRVRLYTRILDWVFPRYAWICPECGANFYADDGQHFEEIEE